MSPTTDDPSADVRERGANFRMTRLRHRAADSELHEAGVHVRLDDVLAVIGVEAIARHADDRGSAGLSAAADAGVAPARDALISQALVEQAEDLIVG